jgi:DNA repair ATPase RecN
VPRYDGWTLVSPPAGPDIEVVAGAYRIRRPVAAGKVETVTLVQELPTDQTIDLADIDESTIRWYVSDPDLPQEVVDAFATLSKRLGAIRDAQWAITDLEQKLATVETDQGRLRDNLNAVPETSDLYQRYLTKLDAAETEIETLQAGLAAARATLIELRVEFTSTARAVNYLR